MSFHRCHRQCRGMQPGSISNLCSATLGAGALSLPFAISLTGIVLGILLLVFSAYLTIFSIDVIVEACARTQLVKYEDVAVQLAGKTAGRALEGSLLIFCFGTAVAYIVAVGDILDQGIRSVPSLWEKDVNGEDYVWGVISMYSRERIMILFWILVMFPLSMQRQVEALERFSPLGVLSIIFLVLAAVIHSINYSDVIGKGDYIYQAHPADITSMLWPNSIWDVIQAIPIIIFAFSCQVNVCAIYEELSPVDVSGDAMSALESKQLSMAGITRKGILMCMTLYICIGLFGFLDFSYATQDNILSSYCIQATHDPLMIAASAFVAVAVVVAFPFNILPARVTLKLILDRLRRRRRCCRCYRFSSGVCIRCLCSLPGSEPQSHEVDVLAPMEDANDTFSSLTAQCDDNQVTSDGLHRSVTDPLIGGDRFGDSPYLIPHMSLEGFPPMEVVDEHSSDSPPLEHFLLTLLLSGSALVVSLLIPGISVVFGLMGGTAASIISFILPGMFLLGINGISEESDQQTKWKKFLAVLLVLGGTLIGFLSTGITIYGLFLPSKNASADSCNV